MKSTCRPYYPYSGIECIDHRDGFACCNQWDALCHRKTAEVVVETYIYWGGEWCKVRRECVDWKCATSEPHARLTGILRDSKRFVSSFIMSSGSSSPSFTTAHFTTSIKPARNKSVPSSGPSKVSLTHSKGESLCSSVFLPGTENYHFTFGMSSVILMYWQTLPRRRFKPFAFFFALWIQAISVADELL
jgi:hypothetical protein